MIAGTQVQYRIKIRFTYPLRIRIQNGGSLKAKETSIHKYNFFIGRKALIGILHDVCVKEQTK